MRRNLSRRWSHDQSCGPLRSTDSVSKVTEHDGREAEIDFYLVGVFCDDSHDLRHGLLVLERSQEGGVTWSYQTDNALRSGPRA